QEFAALLRRHRLLPGLSQEVLAERARLSVRGISDLERGVRRVPHPATIARLAEALGLEQVAREALLLAATHPHSREARPVGPPAAVPAEAGEARAASVADAPKPEVETRAAQRRWVTVLAVQLGGFAALAEWLDLLIVTRNAPA